MTFELTMLFWVATTLFVLMIMQGALTPITQGFAWGLGSRDTPQEPSVLQGRMTRIVANHIEGMLVFAALVIVAHLGGISSSLTELGAALYLGARIVFALVYMAGVPVLRSAVWGVSALGIGLIAFEILTASVPA